MNNKYNVLVTYRGDGTFKFKVKRIGEVSISSTKPIYIYNADTDIISDLRQLKRLLVDLSIGAKPNGAYRTYNIEEPTTLEKIQANKKNVVSQYTMSNNDISSILSNGTSGPIEEPTAPVEAEKEEPTEMPESNEVLDKEEVTEEVKTEETTKPVKKTSTKKSSKKSSKKKK